MAASTAPNPIPTSTVLQNRQHLAWGVLLVAFSVFCALAALVVIGIHYFIFQSSIPLQGVIQVSRGTVVLTGADLIDQAVTREREFGLSGVVTTDAQSQAMIVFRDPYSDNEQIASITLKNGTNLDVRQFTRPRFEWSTEPYTIHLTDVDGDIEIYVPANTGRAVSITAETTSGAKAELGGVGRYTVSVSESLMQVVNYAGTAKIITPDGQSYPIPVVQRGTVQLADFDAFVYAPALTNLLGMATFSEDNVVDFSASAETSRSMKWSCNNSQNSGPSGHYDLERIDGQTALHLVRGDNAESHGETTCIQAFSARGLDISMVSTLSVRATFKIKYHSLSACGVQGSECPLMLRMDYYPTGSSTAVSWIRGFFSTQNTDLGYPQFCVTCGTQPQHEIINTDRWYTFESGNLLASLPQEIRPSSLLNLRFSASGHQYDVYVNSVELLVDQAAIPLPVIEGQG